MTFKSPKKVKDGKKSKILGSAFEKKVRKDLEEEEGFIIDRWSNNVDLENDKLIPSKVTWRRTPKGMFPMGLNSGFPDFVCFRKKIINQSKIFENQRLKEWVDEMNLYEIIGVESKMTGELDRLEKEKCQWLLKNKIFSRILIARKTKIKNKIVVEYEDFVKIEKRMK